MADKKHDEGQPFTRRPLIYGRAKGKALSPRQQSLFADLLPRVAVPVEGVAAGSLDPQSLFGRVLKIHLEVGFGGGEHLAARAAAAPETGFIGCEPFINGVAKALTGIEEGPLDNIRLHHGDARDVLDVLKSASLDLVYILYPDPWPKTRHNKRRFIGPDTLTLLARVIRPGGILRIASDIPDYIKWTDAEIAGNAQFTCLTPDAASRAIPPEGWPGTRYEAKAIREGRTPAYLEFERNA